MTKMMLLVGIVSLTARFGVAETSDNVNAIQLHVTEDSSSTVTAKCGTCNGCLQPESNMCRDIARYPAANEGSCVQNGGLWCAMPDANESSLVFFANGGTSLPDGGATCPSTHPWAYRPNNNFDYCCATADDNEGNKGINSNSDRSSRSTNCKNHQYKDCSKPPCEDYQAPTPRPTPAPTRAPTRAPTQAPTARMYMAAAKGSCTSKVGYGIIRATGKDCRAMGGAMNGYPADSQWTDCHLDWCTDRMYKAAAKGSCTNKVGYGIIRTTGRDCRAMRGAMNGYPADSQWTDCGLDWCTDGMYKAAATGSCTSKVGYGIIRTTGKDCRAMGGAMNGYPGDTQWIGCHLDWCTG